MKKQTGFALIASIAGIIVIAAVVVAGVLVYRHNHKSNPANSNSQQTANKPTTNTKTQSQASDPYAGWKTATSPRAQFSIKYPDTWTYSETLGSKDNVEHILITGPKIELRIDSYEGSVATNGGTTQTTCPDCESVVTSQAVNISGLGSTNLETITYSLDNRSGNAVILIQPNHTYYITSPKSSTVKTTFRGISILDSEQAYQDETLAQFADNSDLSTAKKILQSISY